MKKICFARAASLLTALVSTLLVGVGSGLAQSPDPILEGWSVDGGGGTWVSANGQTVLQAGAGQPDAHLWMDGDYILVGGLWSGAPALRHIYLPLVVRGV